MTTYNNFPSTRTKGAEFMRQSDFVRVEGFVL
jgi:hypothetical protein